MSGNFAASWRRRWMARARPHRPAHIQMHAPHKLCARARRLPLILLRGIMKSGKRSIFEHAARATFCRAHARARALPRLFFFVFYGSARSPTWRRPLEQNNKRRACGSPPPLPPRSHARVYAICARAAVVIWASVRVRARARHDGGGGCG